MALLRCPHCRSRVELDDRFLGRDVQCGDCGNAFLAPSESPEREPRDDDEDEDVRRKRRKRRRRSRLFDDFDDEPEETLEAARAVCEPPARGLIWTGWLGAILIFLGGVAMIVFGVSTLDDPPDPKFDKEDRIAFIVIGCFIAVLGPLLFIFLAIAGHKLKSMSSYGWSMAGAIMGIVSPAITHPCNPLTWAAFAFGIWALVALNKPESKWAFEYLKERREH